MSCVSAQNSRAFKRKLNNRSSEVLNVFYAEIDGQVYLRIAFFFFLSFFLCSATRKSPRTRTPAPPKKPAAPSAKAAKKMSKRAAQAAKRRFEKQECTLMDCMEDAFQPTQLVGGWFAFLS